MLTRFEIAILWALHIAGLAFETRSHEEGKCRVFDVCVSSYEESWKWSQKVCALARALCSDSSLVVSLELENGLGETLEMWLRRWSHESLTSKWHKDIYESHMSFCWVTTNEEVSYSFYFNVKE